MDSAKGSNEFVTDLSAQCPRLSEAQVVRIGRLSPTHEACLLSDEPEMLLVAVASRLGNREGALVDTFDHQISGRS